MSDGARRSYHLFLYLSFLTLQNPNILSNLEVPVPAFCRLGTKNHEYKPYIWLGVGG